MVRNTVTPSNPNAKRTAPLRRPPPSPGHGMVLTREHKNLEREEGRADGGPQRQRNHNSKKGAHAS